MYRNKNHTEKYLHGNSHHFPAQTICVLNMLATRALRISIEDHLSNGKSHLLNVSVNNGYSRQKGLKAFLKASKGTKIKKDPIES